MERLAALLTDLWPLFLLIALYVGFVTALLVAVKQWAPVRAVQSIAATCLVCLTFAVAGMCTGYLTGLSRSPATDSVVPAVLTAFGGLSTYLIALQPRSQIAHVVVATISLFLFFLFGSLTGSQVRVDEEWREADAVVDWETDYETQAAIALRQSKIKKARSGFGLDGDFYEAPRRTPESAKDE